MISFLAFSEKREEVKQIVECSYYVSAILTESDLKTYSFMEYQKIREFLQKNPIIDISCIDVTVNGGIPLAEQARTLNQNMCMIILADSSLSPMEYIRPSITANSLLLRPFSKATLDKVVRDCFADYLRRYQQEDGTDNFVIDNRDGRQLIPYQQIVFFESRSKKIFVNTGSKEYSLYDTLDNLEKQLQGDSFIRCHRSFIVSKRYIDKVIFSRSIILLENGYEIPLSRTYRSSVKECMH